jgi:hypothetical protein
MKNESKICKVCGRPFNWRKKWKLNWENVKYCSKRCYGSRNKSSVLSESQL